MSLGHVPVQKWHTALVSQNALEELASKLSSETDVFRLDAAELSKLLRSVVARFSLETRYAAIREMDESGEMHTKSEVEDEKYTTKYRAQARRKERGKVALTKAVFLAKVGAESDLNSKVAALLLRQGVSLSGTRVESPATVAILCRAWRMIWAQGAHLW